MRHLRILAVLGLAGTAAACGSSNSTGTGSEGTVALNFATNARAAAAVMADDVALRMAPETYTDGTNTLVINTVDIVLRKIELKLANPSGTCPDVSSDDDDCEEINLAPRIFSLPLGTSTSPVRSASVSLPAGAYEELEFRIHRPSSRDTAFLAQNPEYAGRSVKVTGTWNGVAFTYYVDVEAEYEIEFDSPLTVVDGQTTDFTISLDVGSWFRNGSQLINPNTAGIGQQNVSLVRNNIQNSVEAFEDDDRDGIDD